MWHYNLDMNDIDENFMIKAITGSKQATPKEKTNLDTRRINVLNLVHIVAPTYML